MLLKRCYVQGFGKLQDFTYEFTQGLNVICTENGWGKSTLAAFLRAMLYGLPQASSRTKLEEAERRKYRPWNGGVMGGFLEFEANGKEYKLERTFGKKEAEDTFRLIDLSTNLDSADFSAELGRELFGLDKEAYSRTTYLPQNKITDGGMNDSIGKKLGKMAEGEDDGGNFDKAYSMLDELRKKYVPDRQKEEKGAVAELTRRISEVQARLEACRRKEESARPWREKEQEASEQRKELSAELERCREKLEAAAGYEALAAKKRHYTELCSREELLQVKKESMRELFQGEVPQLSELQRCRQEAEEAAVLAGELRSYRMGSGEWEELERLQHKFADGVPSREEIQECIRNEGEIKEQLRQTEQWHRQLEGEVKQTGKLRKIGRVLTILFFLLAVGCGIGALCGRQKSKQEPLPVRQEREQKESMPFGGGIWTGGCVCFLLGGFVMLVVTIRKNKEEQEKENRLTACSGELERLRGNGARGEMILARYGVPEETDITGALYRLSEEIQKYELLTEQKIKQKQCAEKRDGLLRGCKALLEQQHMDTEDIAGSLHILENRTRDFLRISDEIAEAAKKREQFELENPPQSFYEVTPPEIGFGELQKAEQELLVKIARVTEEEKDCRHRAEVFEEEAEEGPELEELYAELTENLEAKKREHFYIIETMKCLKTAKEQFSSRYLRGLTTGFDNYVALLGDEDFRKSTGGHFDGVHTDVNLNVRVSAYGEERELGYFSTGMRDFIGLCMRFALVDALFTEEAPFLVLDDPFVNLDKGKVERAVAFLKEASGRYQILYLVCHDSRA